MVKAGQMQDGSGRVYITEASVCWGQGGGQVIRFAMEDVVVIGEYITDRGPILHL